jgi:PHD/YefM family antitoxin component YafN of YafNO toxin-antitoxin module
METVKVGIREFRDNLATYLLESSAPVAITRHGDTVGYYIPARRKRSAANRVALREAAAKWHETMAAAGITEEEAMEEFKQLRAASRK